MQSDLYIKKIVLIVALMVLATGCEKSAEADINDIKIPEPEIVAPVIIDSADPINLAFVVEVDRSANVFLKNADGKSENTSAKVDDSDQLRKLLSGVIKTKKNSKSKVQSDILIRCDSSLNYDQVLKVIEGIKRVSDLPIWLRISDGLIVFIQSEKLGEVPMGNPKPNVFYLQVTVDSRRNLAINGEKHNDLSDATSLGDRLTELFKGREEAGAFREGSNEIEKTVYIKAARSLSFSDVIKTVKVVASSGANPIGLLTYDLEE